MRLNIYVLGTIIILFSFLEPDYFTSIPIVHGVLHVIRLIGIFVAIIISIKKSQFLYVSTIVVIYYAIYAYSTYLQNGDFSLLISHSILTIGFIMWLEILLRNKPNIALHSLNIIYSILVYANIIFFMTFTEGYNDHGASRYLLGIDNQFAATLIPAVVVSVTYSLIRFNKVIMSTKILIGAVLFTFTYFWSATSVVGISLIILYLLLIHKGWLKYFVNYKTISFLMIFLFLTVVYFNSFNIFAFIIEGLLDKDLTLSTRTVIWEQAKLMISESPLFGYGAMEGNKFIYFNQWNQKDAHNMILNILLQSGILGLSIIILLFLLMFKKVTEYKSHPVSRFILFSLFASTTMMLSEIYAFRFLFLILLLGIFTPSIIKAKYGKRINLITLDG